MSPFAALEAQTCWVAWRNEQRGNKATKVPYGTWAAVPKPMTLQHGSPAPRRSPRHSASSTAAAAGSAFSSATLGADLFLCSATDLDSCIADGDLAAWAGRVLDVLGTYAETSPSGSGVKAS